MTARQATARFALLLVVGTLGACARPATEAPPAAQARADGQPATGVGVPANGAGAASAPAASAPSRPRESLTFSIPSLNLNYIVPMTAAALGFFAEEGLDVEILPIAPNLTVAAMQRGDVKITGTGGSTIRSVVNGGAPFTLIAFMTVRPTYYVFTAPELRTPADLVGKRMGVASLADTPHLFTNIWLRQRGVDPAEVTFLSMGPEPATRVSAMQAGALDGSIFDPGSAAVAEALGFRLMQDLGEVIQDPQQGIVASNEFLQTNPGAARAFLKGLVRGLRYSKEHVPEVAGIARQTLELDMNETIATRAVQLYVDGISAQAPGYADPQQVEAFYHYDVRVAMELPAEQPIPTLHDLSYLLETYDELGIPRPQ